MYNGLIFILIFTFRKSKKMNQTLSKDAKKKETPMHKKIKN